MNEYITIAILSLGLVCISCFREKCVVSSTVNDSKLPSAKVVCIRFLHYMISLSAILYCILFNSKTDYLMLGIVLFVFGTWKIFNNECILTRIEKNEYSNNLNISHPYIYFLIGDREKYGVLLIYLGIICNLLYIVYRNTHNLIRCTSCVIAVAMLSSFIQFTAYDFLKLI